MIYKFKIFEIKGDDNIEVISGEGKNKEAIQKECTHYAMMYGQDGEIAIWTNYETEIKKTFEEISEYMEELKTSKACSKEAINLLIDFIDGKVIKGKDISSNIHKANKPTETN